MEQNKVFALKNFSDLFNAELERSTVVDARFVPNADWKDAIPNLVPLLMTDGISRLYVSDSCVFEVRGRIKFEFRKVFSRKYGEAFVLHGRKFSFGKLVDFDLLSKKVYGTHAGPFKGEKKLRILQEILNDVGPLFDMCQNLEQVLERALTSLHTWKQTRLLKERNDEFMSDMISNSLKETTMVNSSANNEVNAACSKDFIERVTEAPEPYGDISHPKTQLHSIFSRAVSQNLSGTRYHNAMKRLAHTTPAPLFYDPETDKQESIKNGSLAKKCYICKTLGKSFSKRLCKKCAVFNNEMRHQRTNLKGRFAVVTGGRIKIGYQTVLKLLRDGCYVIATTRFPCDAAKRYTSEPDHEIWCERLKIYPLDLLAGNSVQSLMDYVYESIPYLDILINNAAQTISRPMEFYRHLLPKEKTGIASLSDLEKKLLVPGVQLVYPNVGTSHAGKRRLLTNEDLASKKLKPEKDFQDEQEEGCSVASLLTSGSETRSMKFHVTECSTKQAVFNEEMKVDGKEHILDRGKCGGPKTKPQDIVKENAKMFLTKNVRHEDIISLHTPSDEAGIEPSSSSDIKFQETQASAPSGISVISASTSPTNPDLAVLFPLGITDEDGEQLDFRAFNSWKYHLCDVPLREMLDVFTINALGPFILVARLKELMQKSPNKRKFIINVSAMEGQFHRKFKTPHHPHTNMAKAALNMLTRTSGLEFQRYGIYMTAVDTGWVTDERPLEQALYEQSQGFKIPLDCVEGASRIYHPIVKGTSDEAEPYFAVFLKDFKPAPW